MAPKPAGSASAISGMVNARVEFWTLIVNRLGLPTVILGAVGWFFWAAYQDIGKPIAATHIKTLDTLAESSKSTAESFKVLAVAHEDTVIEARTQKVLLERIGTTQDEIKAVLKEQLRVTKSSAADAHTDAHDAAEKLEKKTPGLDCDEKPQPGPPGT